MDQLPTLQQGASGLAVAVAQRLLVLYGCDVGPTGVDGQFGPNTFNAVQKFQRTQNITVDGIIGPNTWQTFAFPAGTTKPKS